MDVAAIHAVEAAVERHREQLDAVREQFRHAGGDDASTIKSNNTGWGNPLGSSSGVGLKSQPRATTRLPGHRWAVGSDIKVGECVLKKNDRIAAAHVGVLVMLGIVEVKVVRAPLVGIISTGNEVQPLCAELKPGQIRDSNKYTLLHFLRRYSYQPRDYGIARDDPNAIKRVLEKAFAENDFVITSGGVSMGEFDIIKRVLLEDFDAVIHFGRVNMKPGKPTTFATLLYNGKVKMFFGLPGNPVSCCVTCILFVIPALRYFERSSVTVFPYILHKCIAPNSDIRPEYQRVTVGYRQAQRSVSPYDNQVSSKLNSMIGANGLRVVEKNQSQQRNSRKIIIFDDLLYLA